MRDRLVLFLRWTEQYTKTDMLYLIHGGFWLVLAQIAAGGAAFFITILLANLLAPEVLGEYRFLIAGFSMLSVIALPGMRSALRESTPKGYLGNLRTAFRTMMRFGAFGSAAAFAVAAYYFVNDNDGLAVGFVVIALALPFFDSSSAYLEFLNALKRFREATVYTFFTRVALLLATATAVILYPEYSWAILAAFLLGHIVPGLLFHFKTKRAYVPEDAKSDSGLLHYAKHLSAMAALGLVAGQLDKVFVWQFIGAEGLAIFYIAYAIPQEVGRLLGNVSMLAFPKFAVANPRDIRRTLFPKIFKYLLVIALGALAYIIIAPYIFTLLFSQYESAVVYSQVLILGALATAFSPIRTFLTTQKETRSLYILSIVPPAVRIAAAALLIVPFGLWGAVIALLGESLVRVLLLVFFFLRARV